MAPLEPVNHGRRRLPGTRAILALMLREMATVYGRSPGGYVWALLLPVLGILVLAVVFGLVMRSPPLGTSFAYFYATGLPVFVYFTGVSYAAAGSLRFSKPLLQFPAVTWVDAMVARFLLTTLTSGVAYIIVLSAIIMIYEIPAVLDLWLMLLSWCVAGALGFGIGALNCYIVGTFPAWENVWALITRPLLLISGVILLPENLPPFAAEIILWNPVSHPVMMMRAGAYPTYSPDYISVAYPLGVALVALFLGLVMLRRNYQAIING